MALLRRLLFLPKAAIAKSSLLTSLEISKSDLAQIMTAYLVAYDSIVMTAMLSRRVATRVLLLSGMAISLGCNLVFGFSYLAGQQDWPLLLFNVVNGFAQSTGWPGNVGVLGNPIERKDRGRIGFWADRYQLGSILAAWPLCWLSPAPPGHSGASIAFGVWIYFGCINGISQKMWVCPTGRRSRNRSELG